MTLQINGKIGQIALYVLGIVVGLSLVVGFALPAALVGIWLMLGAALALVGV